MHSTDKQSPEPVRPCSAPPNYSHHVKQSQSELTKTMPAWQRLQVATAVYSVGENARDVDQQVGPQSKREAADQTGAG